MIRVIAGIIIIEFFNHFTIIFSIHENELLIKKTSKFTIAIALLLKGALFSVKYIVFYGVPTFFNEIVGMKVRKSFCIQEN
jgi:hypothetical protein